MNLQMKMQIQVKKVMVLTTDGYVTNGIVGPIAADVVPFVLPPPAKLQTVLFFNQRGRFTIGLLISGPIGVVTT